MGFLTSFFLGIVAGAITIQVLAYFAKAVPNKDNHDKPNPPLPKSSTVPPPKPKPKTNPAPAPKTNPAPKTARDTGTAGNTRETRETKGPRKPA